MNLAHIGIAVKSLKESVPIFEKILGTKASEIEFVEEQKVNVQKFHIDNCEIELLEGTAIDSPITTFIEKKGEGIHHISLGVKDITTKLVDMEKIGVRLIDKVPRIGADNMLIAFLHPKSTNNILIEFTENK